MIHRPHPEAPEDGHAGRRAALLAVVMLAVLAPLVASCGTPSGTPPTTTLPTTTTSVPSTTTAPPTTSPPTTTAPATTTPATSVPPTTTPAVPSLPAGLGGREWNLVPTAAHVVALTFDAGANADGLPSILATLRRDHVPATFFLTGDFVERFPDEARSVASAGMRIGDHSVSHPYFTTLADAEMRRQVLEARAEIRSVTGADPWPWFRFPYFDRDEHAIAVVNSVGFVPIGWTVDTLGWKGTSSGITVQTVLRRVLAALRPGEIVVMHCGSNPTDHSTLDAEALPSLIDQLRSRGYGFVSLDALKAAG